MTKLKLTPEGVLNNSCKATIVCGICLTEMNSETQEISQCKTCKKCIHNECNEKWSGNCVYCRN